MTIKEMRDELNKLIELGNGDVNIRLIDSDLSMCCVEISDYYKKIDVLEFEHKFNKLWIH